MVQTKKSLGQYFLRSAAALRKMVLAGNLSPSDTVLEIGPGEGALTRELLHTGARVIAVEKDDRLIDMLRNEFIEEERVGKFILIHGDILDPEIRLHVSTLGCTEGKFLIIANIPYYITGILLRMILDEGPRPLRMVLLLQKEVVDEVLCRSGKGSILSNALATYGTPRFIAKVPRGAFVPAPSVDSAILLLENIHNPFASQEDRETFFDLLRSGFATKRKTLLNNLSRAYGTQKNDLLDILKDVGINPTTRPEDLLLSEWFTISKTFRLKNLKKRGARG